MKRKFLVISAGRSDYDRYYPILKCLNKKILKCIYLLQKHTKTKGLKTFSFIDKDFSIIKNKYNFNDFRKNMTESFSEDLSFLVKKLRR